MYEKWCGWLTQVETHVLDLHHHRQLWQEIKDAILKKTGDTSDIFLTHYTRLYVDGQVMAVRRLVSHSPTDKKSISLGRLIADVQSHPTVMSRDRYVSLHKSPSDDAWVRADWERMARETYDDEWGDGQGNIDAQKLQADLDRLDELSGKVRAFANRMVAHIDRRGLKRLPTFKDLNDAIDVIGEMFKRYALLLTASSWASVTPTIQEDWRATFRSPLFEPRTGGRRRT